MFENIDGRRTDGRTTDAGVTGILLAHLRAFGSGELKKGRKTAIKFSESARFLPVGRARSNKHLFSFGLNDLQRGVSIVSQSILIINTSPFHPINLFLLEWFQNNQNLLNHQK